MTTSALRSKETETQEFLWNEDSTEKVFPFPQFIERQVQAKWSKPMANQQFPHFVKKLYRVPSYATELLQVPLEDAPVVVIQSYGLLSEDGRGKLEVP